MTDRFEKLEEEADALLAGLNAPTNDTATDSTPPPEETDAPAPAEPETAPDDEVAVESADATPEPETAAEAPPEQQEEMVPLSRYKNAEKLMHARSQEAADLRRRNAQLEAEFQQLQARATPPASPNTAATGDEDPELREFAEFYPEIAKPVSKQLQAMREKLERQEVWLAQQRETEQQTAQRAHWEAITTAHPDAPEIAADPQFLSWIADQPPFFQSAVEKGTARDVNLVLDMYKAAVTHPKQPATAPPSHPAPNKLQQARQAAGPNVGRVPAKPPIQHRFTREQIQAMSQAEYEANEAEIDRQMALGMIA